MNWLASATFIFTLFLTNAANINVAVAGTFAAVTVHHHHHHHIGEEKAEAFLKEVQNNEFRCIGAASCDKRQRVL